MSLFNPKTQASTPALQVAFLGLGVMGGPMAAHVCSAGHHVTVYNRSTEKAQAWVSAMQAHATAQGQVRMAHSPFEAAQGADVVLCCVGNDADVRSVLLGDRGAFAGMKPGAVLADHTTTSAALAREMAEVATQMGLGHVDAPVSGGQVGAQNGLLTVMCGGTPEHVQQAMPVMSTFAKAVTHMGPSGNGQLTKMVNQICIAGLLQGLSEGLAFGERAGLDLMQVLSVISKGAAQSWQMEQRGPTMVEGRFDFGFAVDWMRKDLGLVLDEARRNGASTPVTALVDQFYADVQRMGGERWDTSSLIQRLRLGQ